MEDIKSEKDQLTELEKLREEEKYKEFFASAEQAMSQYPDSFPLKFLYAEVLVANKRISEAESVLKDLVLAYPDNINVLLDLGKVGFKLEKYDEAVECFNKILFLDPFNDQAKELLVKIDKLNKRKPGGDEEEGKPPDVITYTKEKAKDKEQPADKRSDIDTTPFTAATKPEEEFKLEIEPDADTKKVESVKPPDRGKSEMEFGIPTIPEPVRRKSELEFDIPSLQEPAQPPPIPPPTPAAPPPQKADIDTKEVPFFQQREEEITEIEFDIPSVEEPAQPPPVPPAAPAAPPPRKADIDTKEEAFSRQPDEEITEIEFDIPSVEEPAQPPPVPPAAPAAPPPKKPDFDTKKVEFIQQPEEKKKDEETRKPDEEKAEVEFGIPSLQEEEEQQGEIEFEIPSVQDVGREIGTPEQGEIEFEIHSVQDLDQEIAETGYDVPSSKEESQDKIEIEYEIPGQEPEPAAAETAADTLVEMEAPAVPEIEQGPPIPPPSAYAPPPGLEDEVPSVQEADQEEGGFEYEIPAREPAAAAADEEFEIPSGLEAEQEEVEIEYEIPDQEPITAAPGEEVEIPPPPPIREEDQGKPGVEAVQDKIIAEPDQVQAEIEYSKTEQETGETEENEEDGRIQQEEAEFMTESAAELYVSQGLLDDALTIYEKLYRSHKNEKYLEKIREISGKRITQKKVQALTRLLKLIVKEGERRV